MRAPVCINIFRDASDAEVPVVHQKAQQTQLSSNLDRQDAIIAEQGDLQAQTQALASEHPVNLSSLTVAQGQYDFSLPIWNAALISWERLVEVLGREPLLSTGLSDTEAATDSPALPPS